MSEKAEIPEALVEEIARIVDPGPEIWECTDGDCLNCLTGKSHARKGAKRAITLVGNAILSGKYPELDKILGVVGRIEILSPKKGRDWIDLGYQAFLDELRVGDTLIALPRQALPGEEEE